MMPEDPMPQDPSKHNESDERQLDARQLGESCGEDFLRWEEELYELGPEASSLNDGTREPEWFAELLDGRLDSGQRRVREAALAEDPELKQQYALYVRTVQSLGALGKDEAADSGSPFLRARILASIQEEMASQSGADQILAAPVRGRGVFSALLASAGVAAAALVGLLYVLDQSPQKESMTKGDDSRVWDMDSESDSAGAGVDKGIAMRQGTEVAKGASDGNPRARRKYSGSSKRVNLQELGELKGVPEAKRQVVGQTDDFVISRGKGQEPIVSGAQKQGSAGGEKKSKGRDQLGPTVGDLAEEHDAEEEMEELLVKRAGRPLLDSNDRSLKTPQQLEGVPADLKRAPSLDATEVELLLAGLKLIEHGHRGPADSTPVYKGNAPGMRAFSDKAKKAGPQVLLFAVEVVPQKVAAVESQLKALEASRLYFSRTLAGLQPNAGGVGVVRSTPPRAGMKSRPSSSTPTAGGEHSKKSGVKSGGSRQPSPPSEPVANDELQGRFGKPKQEQRKGAWTVDSANEGSSGNRGRQVSLLELYGQDEYFFTTSNNLNRLVDEVVVLRGSRDQLKATLTMLVQNSERHAIAYVPKVSLTPVEAYAVSSGLTSKKESLDAEDVSKGKKVARKSQDGMERGDRTPGKPTGGRQAELGVVANKPMKTEEILEIRVLIRKRRYPVPGRAVTPATPATPTPATPSTPRERK